MEINRQCLIWVFMGSLLLLNSYAKDDDGFPSPLKNVNLAPYQKWLNAYKCMLNYTGQYAEVCSEKNKLNMSGIVNVSQSELQGYCKADGCGDHIKVVLNCIHWVKNDFVFENGATVDLIHANITNGCKNSEAFSTAKYKASSSTRNMPALLVIVLLIVLFI